MMPATIRLPLLRRPSLSALQRSVTTVPTSPTMALVSTFSLPASTFFPPGTRVPLPLPLFLAHPWLAPMLQVFLRTFCRSTPTRPSLLSSMSPSSLLPLFNTHSPRHRRCTRWSTLRFPFSSVTIFPAPSWLAPLSVTMLHSRSQSPPRN